MSYEFTYDLYLFKRATFRFYRISRFHAFPRIALGISSYELWVYTPVAIRRPTLYFLYPI